MKNLLKDRSIMLKEELGEIEYEIKLLQEKIKLHEKHIEELKSQSDTKRKSNLDKIDETQKEIAKLNEEIDKHQEFVITLMKSIEDQDHIHKKNTELDKYQAQIKKNLKKLGKDKKFFEEKENCPTCEQDIDTEFKRNKLNAVSDDIEEMDDGLTKIENEIQKVFERLAEINLANKDIQKEENEIRTKNGYIKSHNSFIQHLNEELNNKVEEADEGKTSILNTELEESKKTSAP